MEYSKLVLLRHGQSIFNKRNLFTGWTDVDLSEQGIVEARQAGMHLKEKELYPDICFTSWLKRSIHTAQIAMKALRWEQIDSIRSWKLNERHYGAWQQQDKAAVEAEVGKDLFVTVRRGYDTPPPSLADNDPRLPHNDPKYKKIDPALLPRSESLSDTRFRAVNYYEEYIVPQLAEGKTVLVVAHGNSLRALLMQIEGLSPEQIVKVEVPTGKPLVYTFDATMQLLEKPKD